jgi:hypothetical protein
MLKWRETNTLSVFCKKFIHTRGVVLARNMTLRHISDPSSDFFGLNLIFPDFVTKLGTNIRVKILLAIGQARRWQSR